MLFIATRDEGLLESLAIVLLFRRGYVEPVSSPPSPYHLVVQQLFAMLFETGLELEEQVFLRVLGRIPGFAALLDTSWTTLRNHLVESGYLIRSGYMLSLGQEAERVFRGKGLADLCVSFSSPRSFAAMQGDTLLGHVDPLSLAARKNGPVALALGGRSWLVASVDWARDRVYLEAADEKGGEPLAGRRSGRFSRDRDGGPRDH